jgi:hypothetical protein
MKLRLVFVLAFALALLPTAASAQEPNESTGFMASIERDTTVAAGDRVGGLLVINADAVIDGTVVDFLMVIDGTATITGTGVVEGQITVINGTLVMLDGARAKDVSLIESSYEIAPNARVTGDIDERGEFVFRGFDTAVSIAFWVAFTLVVVAGALAFAAVGGAQLRRAATTISSELGKTLLSTLFVWIALPIIAVLIMITVVGLALGFSILIYVLPSLWFLGYIAMGTRIGIAITGMMKRPSGEHPYLAAVVGVLILQLATWIPVLGALSAALAGIVGAGAIFLVAWRAIRARTAPSTPTASVAPESPHI